jgi:peptide deformylase
MAVLQIRALPDPLLRQKAKRVTEIDNSIQKLIEDMIDTSHADHNRAGLVIPQVGGVVPCGPPGNAGARTYHSN